MCGFVSGGNVEIGQRAAAVNHKEMANKDARDCFAL